MLILELGKITVSSFGSDRKHVFEIWVRVEQVIKVVVGNAEDLGGAFLIILWNKSIPINELENVANVSEVTTLTKLDERLGRVSIIHFNFTFRHKIDSLADLPNLDQAVVKLILTDSDVSGIVTLMELVKLLWWS